MPTILDLSQGGTGVQSARELKDLLGMGPAAAYQVSQDPNDTTDQKLVTSYVLHEKTKNLVSDLKKTTTSLENGGTGATTAAGAFKNIVGSDVIPVSKGGTGASDPKGALENLIPDALPISRGGTGATTPEEAVRNLGIGSTTIQYPISIENGGTGGRTPEEALVNLGISRAVVSYPISISNGGTGATDAESARANLGLELPLPLYSGGTGVTSLQQLKNVLDLKFFESNVLSQEDDLNLILRGGVYISPRLGGTTPPTSETPKEEGISPLSTLEEGEETSPVEPTTPSETPTLPDTETTTPNPTTPEVGGTDGSVEPTPPTNPTDPEVPPTTDDTNSGTTEGSGEGSDGGEQKPDGPQSPIVVVPPVDPTTPPDPVADLHYPTADLHRFLMLVMSNINTNDSLVSVGVATQLLVVVEPILGNPIQVFVRNFERKSSDQVGWGDWLEIQVGGPTPVAFSDATPIVSREWETTTAENTKTYTLSSGRPIPPTDSGVWLVFLGDHKLSKSAYTLNSAAGSITLLENPTPNQVLSVSFVGKS